MSAWRPRMSKNSRLLNASFVDRKPEPLGTEFKTVCYPSADLMTRLEIQRGKHYYQHLTCNDCKCFIIS